jgi:hypothetical protein
MCCIPMQVNLGAILIIADMYVYVDSHKEVALLNY